MKKMFIFLSCLAWAVSAFCQYHALTQAQYSDPVTKTIVREYSYPTTISYVETPVSHYFAIADQSLNIRNSVIDTNIFVRDFVIFGDMVYFCGIDRTSGTNGIFGWFHIGSLINGNLVYQTYSQFTCSSYLVDTLHSLTAFQGLDGLHVVTVGTTTGGGAARGCTIDIHQSSGTPVAWTYTIGVTPERERLKHVCQTDNWVVTSGPSGFSEFEGYRVHKKTNVFTPGGIEDTVCVFVMSNLSPGTRDIEQYAIAPMTGDIVASALMVDKSGSYGIQVFAHDMNNLVNGAVNPVFSCSQNTGSSEMNVYGLKYDSPYNALVLLLNSTNMSSPLPVTGAGSIVAEIPAAFAMTVPYTIHILGGIILTSLDLYRLQQHFLCQGAYLGMLDKMVSFIQPLNSAAHCAVTNYSTGLYEDYMTKMEYRPYTLCQNSITFTVHQQLDRIDAQNIIQCQY